MEYGDTAFAQSDAANLKRSGGEFYMNNNEVDTAGIMFSLIDVQYLDPRDSSKVAYHLYVPVLVKKLLKFNFEIWPGSGTTYDSAAYVGSNAYLIENAGTPATVYFRYTYLRSRAEWESAINGGDSVLRNYAKTLTLTPQGSGSTPFSSDTILVLVDRGTGTPYYAHFGNAVQNGVLYLDRFKDAYSANDSAGNAFTPSPFNSYLDITAAQSAEGKYVQCDESTATVMATLDGTVRYFRRVQRRAKRGHCIPSACRTRR
jgi:hypothetical protein